MCLDLRVLCTILSPQPGVGTPCMNLLDILAIDILLPKSVGMQTSSRIYHIRKWYCLQEQGGRVTFFQEMFLSHPAISWLSQLEITHFWKIIHELSIEEVKERGQTEFSKLVGSLVFSYSVSHYFVFHCHPHAISVSLIPNSQLSFQFFLTYFSTLIQ